METTDDAILGGRLRLRQPKRGHRFGHDAILLAAAVDVPPRARIVEFGAGVGAAGLSVLTRLSDADVTLLEIDPALTALAQDNIARNGFASRARALTLDVTASMHDFAAAGLAPGTADAVAMNPPFNPAAAQASPDAMRRTAHQAHPGLLTGWIASAARLVKADGGVNLIWRAEGLQEALDALSPHFGAIAVRPVHPAPGKNAIRIIVTAIRASRSPLTILPALTLQESDGAPSAQADRILRKGAALNE